jgi:hypothetical protein
MKNYEQEISLLQASGMLDKALYNDRKKPGKLMLINGEIIAPYVLDQCKEGRLKIIQAGLPIENIDETVDITPGFIFDDTPTPTQAAEQIAGAKKYIMAFDDQWIHNLDSFLDLFNHILTSFGKENSLHFLYRTDCRHTLEALFHLNEGTKMIPKLTRSRSVAVEGRKTYHNTSTRLAMEYKNSAQARSKRHVTSPKGKGQFSTSAGDLKAYGKFREARIAEYQDRDMNGETFDISTLSLDQPFSADAINTPYERHQIDHTVEMFSIEKKTKPKHLTKKKKRKR